MMIVEQITRAVLQDMAKAEEGGVTVSNLRSIVYEIAAADLAAHMDRLGVEFFSSSKEDRARHRHLPSSRSKNAVERTLHSILINHDSHEIGRAVADFAVFQGHPVVRVFSAVALRPVVKKEIRSSEQKRHRGSYVVFEVDRSILGGLRILRDGNLLDYTWLRRVNNIFNQNYEYR